MLKKNSSNLFDCLNTEFLPSPIIHNKELVEGVDYDVEKLRGVCTKYGPKIVADLVGVGTLFLPNRYVQRFLKDGQNPRELIIPLQNTILRMVGRETDKHKTPIFEFLKTTGSDSEDNDDDDYDIEENTAVQAAKTANVVRAAPTDIVSTTNTGKKRKNQRADTSATINGRGGAGTKPSKPTKE